MEKTTQEMDYSKISPTAKIPAYWRALSDIPFSKEIAEAIDAESTAQHLLGDKLSIMANFSPVIFEARYKSIDEGIKKTGVHHVLELACGLSPRGLQLAADNKQYVGTDLPGMLAETESLINDIAGKQGIPKENLHYQPANVLDKMQLEAAAAHFKGERFAVCNEGLLMYFTREERAAMAGHLHDLLKPVNGCWITTDIGFHNIREQFLKNMPAEGKKVFESIMGSLSDKVGRDITQNVFGSEDERTFYTSLGFRVETFPFYDGSYRLSTLDRIPEQAKQKLEEVLGSTMVWILYA